MSDTSATLSLPYLMPAQAQKHVTHNDALDRLDLVVQLVVTAFDATNPPASPTEGECYAIGQTPTGEWVGKAGLLTVFQNSGWVYVAPQNGWLATTDRGDIRLYSGGTWVDARNQNALQNLPELGINATADSTNRLSISSDAVLLNHAGAGHQVKVNKASTSDTASLLFQSNWSGRAEMGLSGTDDFAVKISPDGNTWTAALSVDATNGNVTLAQALTLTPAPTPTSPTAGMLYFDGTTTTLRCYDGNQWHDLF
ncbi:DUF2793 domain-containing protein [Paradonghicola geojensis]|nr:DUF2793 domain-containing protein [Marivivens geojensis]